MPLAIGTQLGPYEVLAPLGAGGMGEVYKARDTRLDRMVAIKVLPEHLSSAPDLKTRFEREARAVSSLNHPHICTLYDIGSQDGIDFLVMEHIEGETLAARLERGPLPTPEVLRHAAEIADALDKAHRQGMVHRDLKPGNVMLTKSGAKLLDFGLARVMGASAMPGSGASGPLLSQTPTMSQPLTAAGAIVGTFQYMAPEQLEGKEADARSDIWAFGATVYEMATARKAFTGHSQASLIASILKEQPRPIAELEPLTPPGLDRIVDRCLAKDPDDRWQSARDLAHELKWIAQAGSKAGVPAPVAARRRNQGRLTAALAGVSTVGMIGFALAWYLRAPAKPETMRFEIRPPSFIQFQDAPRISPDGHILAYSATDSTGVSRVWLRPLNGTTATPLAGTEGIAFRPFWSPDSRYLGFFAGGKLKKIAASGGPAITLCDAANGADGSWSGSGSGVILYDGGGNDPIFRVPAGGGVPVPAASPDSVAHTGVGWPCFLPDGRHFLFMRLGGENSKLCAGKLDSKEERVIGPTQSRAEYGDGHLLMMRGGSLVAQGFDAGALKLEGDPFPVAEQVRPGANGGADFSLSRTGTLAYSLGGSQNGRLVWEGLDGKTEVVQGTASIPTLLNLALSPDGRRVALRAVDDASRTRDLWLVDLTRGVSSRFTFDSGNENHPLWSADGGKILYYADRSEARGIHVKSATGVGSDELWLKSTDDLVPDDWSKDGRYVVYENQRASATVSLWVLSTFGDRKPFAFLEDKFNVAQGRLSPDGKWIAYSSDESGRVEIYVQTFPEHGGKWQISTNGGLDPRWRADGKALYYLSNDQRMMEVDLAYGEGFQAGVPRALFPVQVLFPGLGLRTHYDVTADGKRFLLASPTETSSLAGTQLVLHWSADARR